MTCAFRVQLQECLYQLVKWDFPQKWPNLLPAVMENFRSNQPPRVYGALMALRMIYKKYQYKSREERQPVNNELTPQTYTPTPHVYVCVWILFWSRFVPRSKQ